MSLLSSKGVPSGASGVLVISKAVRVDEIFEPVAPSCKRSILSTAETDEVFPNLLNLWTSSSGFPGGFHTAPIPKSDASTSIVSSASRDSPELVRLELPSRRVIPPPR